MKITVELKDGIVYVNSDGVAEPDEVLSTLMKATIETLCQTLGNDFPQTVLDEIFKDFGKVMTESASERHKQLYSTISCTEKDFLALLSIFFNP